MPENENQNNEVKEFEEEVVPNVQNIKSQETFVVPSKGLFYNNPAMQSITLRRMTIREDKIRLRNEGEDEIRRDLLQACIVGSGIDAGQLTLFDANYLLFQLRRISLLNNIYKVRLTCPHCGTEFINEIDLTKLKINYANPDNVPNLDVTLPVSKLKVSLKFPTLSGTINFRKNILEYMENNPDANLSELLYVYGDMVYIAAINGESKLYEELEGILENLDLLDSRAIKDAVRKLDNVYGIDDDIVCQCPKCKNDIHHGLPITAELFTPSL